MNKLNILKPTKLLTVSDNIDSIINLIEKIKEEGYVYVSEGDVYFSVLKFKDYGTLSKQKIEELKSGARISEHEKKESPLDFTLWKSSKENEVVYDSPWGKGRPGWHIECSAISHKNLGDTIDIHGGGRDLIFPHHENEKAQSESATGKRFVNYWMHTGFLTINGEKMSKSLNNFITAGDLIERYEPNVIRWYLLSRHYRSPIDFAFIFFDEVKTHMDRMYDSIETARVLIDNIEKTQVSESIKIEVDEYVKTFHESIQNDFETPTALVQINELVKIINKITQSQENYESLDYVVEKILELTEILGIHIHFKADDEYLNYLGPVLKKYEVPHHNLNEAVNNLLKKRDELRKEKKYVESDEIRDSLKQANVFVEDLRGKTIWKRG
jgi:cysteinyl-tRNA synthetase